ncbi:MAG TPA: EAL domain-containing protein [Acidimicrobiales bacterium]|nr:EAL domain-containing protein [Acidimicrobiales bacterium]
MSKADQGIGAGELPGHEDIERVCLRNLLEGTNEAIYFKDRDNRFILVSRGVVQHHVDRERKKGAAQATEARPEDFIGKTDMDLFDPDLATEWMAEERLMIETGREILNVLERDTSSDATGGWFQTSKAPLRDGDGVIIGTFGISRDVTAQVMAEQELARREGQLRAVLDSSPDAIVCYNSGLRYEMVNARAAAALGAAPADILGRTDEELGRPSEVVAVLRPALQLVLETRQMHEVEYSCPLEGRTVWWHARIVPQLGPDGSLTGIVVASRDLTEIKDAQSVLAHQATHDSLTGLPNRFALMEKVKQALAGLKRNPGRIALLFIDLDNFKLVNDAHGHTAGDEVLREAAARLRAATRPGDTVARLGGDEFVVLLDRLSPGYDALTVASRIMRSLGEGFSHFSHGTEGVNMTASIGVMVSAGAMADPEALLRDADIAMYRAKSKGRDRVEMFHPALRDRADQRHKLVRDLQLALERAEFFLVYQPVYSLATGTPIGAEALLRWQHPQRGVVPPADFISAAEETGLIHALGRWALNEACAERNRWSEANLCPPSFAIMVNVSARQLATNGFVAEARSAIADNGLLANQLCLELTAPGAIEELDHCSATLEALSGLGARLALDDFPTGYSSLAHLHAFRANTLKIDRSFVARLENQERDAALVAAIVTMAHSLGMDVIAEGVETEQQRHKVAGMGCDGAQGYLFAKPLRPVIIKRLLANQFASALLV